MHPLLSIKDLHVALHLSGSDLLAVRGVSLDVMPGEVVAIVGESGSGKSLTALSITGLLPQGIASVASGSISFRGAELTKASRQELNRVRGEGIGMIFQEPLSALNPVMRIGEQIVEGLVRKGLSRAAARAKALTALNDVRISDPERRLGQYPHELSGGMRQRVMIALALIAEPDLLIADEPTTALDVTVQAQVLALLRTLQKQRGLAMIIITHDLGIVAETADRVVVMYAGQVVESGPVAQILSAPSHPYTIGLLSCLPDFSSAGRRLNVIPGTIVPLSQKVDGCRFKNRCPIYTAGDCDSTVELEHVSASHAVRCVKPVGDHEQVADLVAGVAHA